MPTYSYRCTECGTAFDIQQAFTDDSLTECPSCAGRLRKLFNSVGVTFNGSGFYRTDSRTPPKESGGEKAAAPAAEKKSETVSSGSGSGSTAPAASTSSASS